MHTHPFLVRPAIVAGCLAALLSAITCGGDVVVDDPPLGSGGNGQGATGTGNRGATGNVGNQGATGTGNEGNTDSVGQGGQGNVGNQSGAGGARFCHTCAQEVQCQQGLRDPTVCQSELCPGSDQRFEALLGCVCGFCSMECFSTCQGGPPEPPCQDCQIEAVTGPCAAEFADCSNDI